MTDDLVKVRLQQAEGALLQARRQLAACQQQANDLSQIVLRAEGQVAILRELLQDTPPGA